MTSKSACAVYGDGLYRCGAS